MHSKCTVKVGSDWGVSLFVGYKLLIIRVFINNRLIIVQTGLLLNGPVFLPHNLQNLYNHATYFIT